MKTPTEYLDSLRVRRLRLWVDGALVDWEAKVRRARVLAGLDPDEELAP